MTAKGDVERPWTTAEVAYLEANAGKVPRRDICRELRRSSASVKTKASRLGLSLRVVRWGLVWCDECASWRSSVGERTGWCRVCEMRRRLAGREAACAEEMARMTPGQRAVYERSEALRGRRSAAAAMPPMPDTRRMRAADETRAMREWHLEVERIQLRDAWLAYDAAKTRLVRMRRAVGTSPRAKKSE